MSASYNVQMNLLWSSKTVEDIIHDCKGDLYDYGLCIRSGVAQFQFEKDGWKICYSTEKIARECDRLFGDCDLSLVYVLYGIDYMSGKPIINLIKLGTDTLLPVHISNFRRKTRIIN